MIDYNLIPERIMPGIMRYVNEGILPGHFLRAVICNDLAGAIGRGDDECLAALHSIVGWFYNEAPKPCWGDKAKMEAWEAMDPEKRRMITAGV